MKVLFIIAACIGGLFVLGLVTAFVLIASPPPLVNPKDVFDFTSPLGGLGRIADALFLERYLRRLLGRRNEEIKRLAESGAWREVLP